MSKCSKSVPCPSHVPGKFQSLMKPLSRPANLPFRGTDCKSSQTTLKLHQVNRVTMLRFLRSGISVLGNLKSDDEQLHRCFWNQTCISNWQLFGYSHCLRTSGIKLAAAFWYVYRKRNYGMYEGGKKWKEFRKKTRLFAVLLLLGCYDFFYCLHHWIHSDIQLNWKRENIRKK